MSNNVDNRVVRMTFDNAKFEKNIKDTMKTLSEFEEKLKFSGASKGFDAIKSAAEKLNFSSLGKSADDVSKKMSNMASDAKNSLDAMQKQLDKTDFSGMGDSASKASDVINKALASINFDDLDKKSQDTLSNMMDSAGKIDFSSITDAAGRVDFSALSDNAAIAIGAVMDLAGDVNFDGIATNAAYAMGEVNSSIDKVDFSSLGYEANEAIGQVNQAASQTDMSPMEEAAWRAASGVTNAIAGIDLYSIVEGTNAAGQGFQALEMVAVGALMNIGAQIENLALSGLKTLTSNIVAPVKDGLDEYQTQIGAIQTILANTGRDFNSAADIAEVNGVLDDLNLYADKTIYNFTEMVKNIGMFTAAGTDMYDAADAIKGMANLAALQGADSVSAARAMYQMSQALSSGSVKLMDWRSLENAGMGGKIFRDVILNAAEKKYLSEGNDAQVELVRGIKAGELKFNDTLTKNEWITSDVLLESLKQLTYAFGDLDDKTVVLTQDERAELQKKKEQAEASLKAQGYTQDEIEQIFELGQKAQDSATKVRTFKQLIETVGEALGSGWAQSWRIILGDFKQTTDLMTKISTALTKVIETWDKGRNNLLSEWANWGGWYELWGGHRQVYETDAEGNIIFDENGDPVIKFEKDVTGALDHIIEAISKPLEAFRDAFADVFGDFFTGEHLYELTKAFNDFTESLILSEGATKALEDIFRAVFEVIKAVLQIGTHVITLAGDIIGVIREITDPIFDIILSIFGLTGEGFADVLDLLLNVENGVFRFIHGALTTLKDVLHVVVGGFFNFLDIPGKIAAFGDAIGTLFDAITSGANIGDILEDLSFELGVFVINVLDFFGLVPDDIDSAMALPEIFKRIYDNVVGKLSVSMDVIIDAIPGLRDFITVMTGDNKEAKVQFFISIFEKIRDIVLPIIGLLVTPVILLKDALLGLWNVFINSQPVKDFVSWLDGIKNTIIDWLLELPGKLAKGAETLTQTLQVLAGQLKAEDVSKEAQNLVNKIGDINITTPFVLLGGGIALGLKTLISAIKTGFGEISEFLFGWIYTTPEEFTSKLLGFVASLPSSFSSMSEGLKNIAKTLLPNSMDEDIDQWFRSTYASIVQGSANLMMWIHEKTEGAETVPDALIAIITGGWDEMVKAIQRFDPEAAVKGILDKLDAIKTGVLNATGGFLDYIFGLKKHKAPGEDEEHGFTFTEYFNNLSIDISRGIEGLKKIVSGLFSDDETIFDRLSKFFVGEGDASTVLERKISNLSTNLETATEGLVHTIVAIATDPSKSFEIISTFIDDHKDDIFTPLTGITTWLDNTLFPNTEKIFTRGLENIKKTFGNVFGEIHKLLEPVFSGSQSWPDFFFNLFNSIAESIGTGIGKIIAYFNNPDFNIGQMFIDIKQAMLDFIETTREKFPTIGDILDGVMLVLSPIFGVLTGLFNGVSTEAEGAAGGVEAAFTNLPATLSNIWTGITNGFQGIWQGFLNALDAQVPGASAVIGAVLDEIVNMFNIFDGTVGTATGGILSAVGTFFDGLGQIVNGESQVGIIDRVVEFFTSLWDNLNDQKLQGIAMAVETFGKGMLLISLSKFVKGLKSLVEDIGDAISKNDNNRDFAAKMKDIAESIVMVALAIAGLAQIKEEDLIKAQNVIYNIAGILVIMEGLEFGLNFLCTKFDIKKIVTARSSVTEILALAITMALLALIPQDALYKAEWNLFIIKGIMTVFDTVGTVASAIALGKAGVNVFAPVQQGFLEIIALAGAMVVLSFIKETDLNKAELAMLKMEAVLAAFQLVTGLLSTFMPDSLKAVDKLSKVAFKLSISIAIICFGFSMLDGMNYDTLALAEQGVVAILGIFGLIAAFTQADDCMKTSQSLLLVGAAVVEMCWGFHLLDGMDPDIIGTAGFMIDTILGIFGLVAYAVKDVQTASTLLATGGAFAIAAFGVVEICYGISQLAGIPPADIEWAVGAIAVITIIIETATTIAGKIGKTGPLLASGGAFALAAFGIIEICQGLSQLAGVKSVDLEWAVGAIGVITIIIETANAISGKIGNAASLLASGGAFAIAAFGVIEICYALKQLDGMNIDLEGAASAIDRILIVIGGINAVAGIMPNAASIIASGGAFALAAFGVIEICYALKQLDGVNLDIAWITYAIDSILLVIGSINAVAGVMPNAASIIASGGAFAIAAFGVIEICYALKQLDGVKIDLVGVTLAIEGILGTIGLINDAAGILPNAAGIIASGGAFALAAFGVVEICYALKQLDGLTIDLEGAASAIDRILIVIGGINAVSGIMPNAASILASGGAFALAAFGVVEICEGLQKLQGMGSLDLRPATEAIDSILIIIGKVNTISGFSLNFLGTLASGGAFWQASMGVVEICNGLKTLDGMDAINLDNASNAIEKIIAIIGKINSSHNIFDSALTLLVGGGAFWSSAHGVVDICVALKELQDIKELDLTIASQGLDDFIAIVKKIPPETSAIATVASITGEDGSLTRSTQGIIDIVRKLETLHGMAAIDFNPPKDSIDGMVEIIKKINDAISKYGTILTALGTSGAFYNAAVGVVDICDVLKRVEGMNPSSIEAASKSISEFTTILQSIEDFLSLPIFEKGNTTMTTISDGVGKLAESLEKMDEVIRAWLDLSKDLPTLLKEAEASIEEVRKSISDKANEFPEKVTEWWTKTAEPAIDELVKKLETKYDKSWGELSKHINNSWDKWWKDEAKTWWNDIPDKIVKAVGDTTKIGSAIVNGIADGIVDAMDGSYFNTTLTNIGVYIYNKITGSLDINSPSKLMRDNVGKAIVEGIGAGLTKYTKLLDKPVIKMGGQTLSYITKYFGIHSPSRLMRDKVGRYIPEGIAAGMDAYAMIAVDSAEDLASSVSQTIYSGLGDVPSASYGVSAVVDIEALKTDIELVHEMLRVKIDEIFTSYREFITEQMQVQFDNESLRYEQILQHMDEADIELYNQLIEYLNTNMMTSFDEYLNGIINYLESALPDMTQQILGAFENTNQSLASILQAMSSEQQSAVDTAITQTIVQQLGCIAETLGSSYEGRTGAKWDVISLLEGMPSNDSLVDLWAKVDNSMKSLNDTVVSALLGSNSNNTNGLNIRDYLNNIWGDLISGDTEMGVGQLLGNLYYALTGAWGPYNGTTLYDYITSMNTGLFGGKADGGSIASSGSIWDYLKAIESNTFDGNNDLSAAQLLGYLNTNLFGSATGKAGDLSATVGNIDENQNAFQKALDKIEESTEKTMSYTHQMTEKDKEILAAIEEEYGHIDSIADLKVYIDKDKMVGALAPEINNFIGEVMGTLERTGPIGIALSGAVNSAFYG